jgi:phosphohistidine phosphatase
MKRLLLLRHAKSSWGDPNLKDFDRPLNDRGMKAAPVMGEFMRARKLDPCLILCSPAKRAKQTVSLVIETGKLKGQLKYDERLYGASAALMLEIVSQTEESIHEVLIVAHNPGMEDLVSRLSGEGHHMPTAALAVIAFNINKWSDVLNQNGQLELFVKPKELPNYWSRN